MELERQKTLFNGVKEDVKSVRHFQQEVQIRHK